MKRILAIDQAGTSGFAVFIDGVLTESGKYTAPDGDYPKRIRYLEVKFEALIDKYDIEIVVVETPMKKGNIIVYHKLSGLYFTTIDLALRKELSYFAYGPSTWRSVLGFQQGRGVKRTELKQMAIAYVNEHTELQLKKSQDDEAEALCLGLAYLKQLEEK